MLLQFTDDENSRTYLEFESLNNSLDGRSCLLDSVLYDLRVPVCSCMHVGLCQLYEQKLKQLNPSVASITYDLSELLGYFDSIRDLCCLT